MNNKLLLYIHGKGGNSREAEGYRAYCNHYDIYGLDFSKEDFTAWGTKEIIQTAFRTSQKNYEKISILANSIGAYFSMNALQDFPVEKAFFISPILNMERLILDMMTCASVSENELREKGEIETDFGEKLSWKYLLYVRDNPIKWNIPTEILYGSSDNLTSVETLKSFLKNNNASVTVMENGEHWFHTLEQVNFLREWLQAVTNK